VALQLKRRGITRVHPLKGGLARWMALSFPVADFRSREPTPPPTLSQPNQAKRG
jgi:rhodanese-related sulfurtransferase